MTDMRTGRALEALRQANQDLDDWIIIYASDHGDMLGEHGVWEKQKFFEGSVRVPLIIRYPAGGLEGGLLREPLTAKVCDIFWWRDVTILCIVTYRNSAVRR